MSPRRTNGLPEIRTADVELQAIHFIQRALVGLDAQAVGRVLTFCIDRARQDFERQAPPVIDDALKGFSRPSKTPPPPEMRPFPDPVESRDSGAPLLQSVAGR